MNKHQKRWRRARQTLTLAFFILVPVLLLSVLKNLDWQEVHQALTAYRWSTLALAAGVTLGSFALFSSFDLLGRHYTGHHLPARQVLPLAFVCYAFNLNLSAWVGGIALRYRLYTRLGLKVPTITRVLSLGLLTNWVGYCVVAGSLFVCGLPRLPAGMEIGNTGLRLIGALLLLVAVIYWLACGFATRRTWRLRQHQISLPGIRLATLQTLMGACSWSLMALVVFTLLPKGADYPTLLAVLMISSIAGVITHIPAGLGVLETVFLTLLHGTYGKGTLLAALIGYRAIYFLLPLLIATLTYLVLEHLASQRSTGDRSQTSG
ncbi:lysylphosphatidylglycerol synthase domain-containing protein [Pseudomonas sp. SBB6]|uniref:lysylphosphatidylglycerol synthase domain-containing protein n=1 Tax=Pseudomonas sp. SBB6 TaxID=2962032 RepID=UPI0020B7B37A|nr:lysylphosphatidylglycerol synthase domain-containing protein [Pseudomonas sp. SBB6]MCP3751911.1 lysylphosphatidylglycerol synthase domain-containing protein [Pseudomonas sp. SBB6]